MSIQLPSIVEGWDIERDAFREAHISGELRKLVTEFSNACTLNCPGCFTVKVEDGDDPQVALQKRRLPNEMSPEQRLDLLREAHDLGAQSVDIVGAGEPMIDPTLRHFVEEASHLGVHVNIFTHGAHRELLEPERVAWWAERPVSFFIKLWSQNPAVNEAMVLPKGRLAGQYTRMRDQAIENLVEAGFTRPTELEFDGRMHRRTRLGADILVTQANYDEIAELFRFCREQNIMPEIKNYIPEGPSKLTHESGAFRALEPAVQESLLAQRVSTADMRRLRAILDQIDQEEFKNVPLENFYTGGTFCTQSMGSLYVPISGRIYSCVGTSTSYGAFVPGQDTLKQALTERREQVGFGCFPRLKDAQGRGEKIPSDESTILSQS